MQIFLTMLRYDVRRMWDRRWLAATIAWGLALVLGPNYNVPMLADRFPAAWDAVQKAQQYAGSATPVEQALIGALAKRYPGPQPKDPQQMAPYNQAYADAMKIVASKFADDDDVQVLYAESLMDLNPWHLWTADGKPEPNTEDIVKTLETVLARSCSRSRKFWRKRGPPRRRLCDSTSAASAQARERTTPAAAKQTMRAPLFAS